MLEVRRSDLFDMNSRWRSKLSRFALLISLIAINARSGDSESSGEYLQKVMIELQELNVPSSALTRDRLSTNPEYQLVDNYKKDAHNRDNAYRELGSADSVQRDVHQNTKKMTTSSPVEHTDAVHSASNNVAQYIAAHEPAAVNYPKVKQQPEPLAFTRVELAALYKKALERGSAISLSSLMKTLNSAEGAEDAPHTSGYPRLPLKYPMYNYYFFPLKSFASELQKIQTAAVAPTYVTTESVESTRKQLMNPLFVAIGTFISVALLFMMGVLFLPKMPHFELFNAREADNDFLRLTTFVTNAIDAGNISNKLQHK